MGFKDKDLNYYLTKAFNQYFDGFKWYEESYERNKNGMLSLLNHLTIMRCEGLDEKLRTYYLLRLDLYKLKSYDNNKYKINVKELKNRYLIIDYRHLYNLYLPDITKWDIDAEADLIERLITLNNQILIKEY